jgi:hypothetical protein
VLVIGFLAVDAVFERLFLPRVAVYNERSAA